MTSELNAAKDPKRRLLQKALAIVFDEVAPKSFQELRLKLRSEHHQEVLGRALVIEYHYCEFEDCDPYTILLGKAELFDSCPYCGQRQPGSPPSLQNPENEQRNKALLSLKVFSEVQ